ncbi:MAG: hypothetical protein A2Y17_12845 [Clostridiales bacterium GWF2_38_85]|nr:MAG: hypothetical protein A2Y17_12845 [Clostridiales bacterium GWF2_38_85]HBL84147.1 ABC transporter [Clostridiales bacterium]
MIKADEIFKSFNSKPVLSDLSFNLPSNGFFAITGISGSGKTTLIRLIAGLEKPDSGTIKVDGQVSVVFQENRLFSWLNVKENIILAGNTNTDISNMLKTLGLESEESKMPSELSGGMQRRVELARALSSDFDILLLDEPFNGLDDDNINNITSVLLEIAQDKAVIIITHDRNYVSKYADKIIEIEN